MASAVTYAHRLPTALLTPATLHPAARASASISACVRSCAFSMLITMPSSRYACELARPRFGRSCEPSGASAAPSPSGSAGHAYGRRLSTRRSFEEGPAAARMFFRILWGTICQTDTKWEARGARE